MLLAPQMKFHSPPVFFYGARRLSGRYLQTSADKTQTISMATVFVVIWTGP